MSRSKQYHIGVDVGGTKIGAVLLNNNKVIEESLLATPKDSLEHFLIMIQAALDPLLAVIEKTNGSLVSIGVGVPGAIDPKKEKIIIARHIPFLAGVMLAEALRQQLNKPDLPIFLDNDVNCFVRAEALLGAGKKATNIYGMTVGTGIGGGWYHNGQVYHGFHGSASEIGHVIVDFDELITLEQAYHKLTQRNASLLAEEAYRGDILAEKAFEELGTYLGIALSTIVNVLDPELIILGGSVLNSSNLFLEPAKTSLKEHIFSPEARSVRVVKGKLGPMAGAIGAGLMKA